MRIGILKESLCFGGTEHSTANTSKILCVSHDVYVALYDGSNIKYSFGGNLVDFKLPAKNRLLSKISNNILRILKYNRLIKQQKLDVLYEFISINNPISKLKHRSAIRIISSRDFSVLSTHIKRFNQCLRNADALICNSRYLREYFITQYPEQRKKVFTVYNYIDTEEIKEQAQESTEQAFLNFLSSHSATIVSVGRFCKEKGFEYLIESLALARKENNDIGLVLVGDGDYKNRYKDIIDKFDLGEHIYLTGFQKNPYKYVKPCTAFILSSLSEGFPNVLAEAMALGLPVIATNCFSGPAEILRKDGNYNDVTEHFEECDYGILIPPMKDTDNSHAIEELSKAIIAMISQIESRQKYAQLSYQRALDFSEKATIDKLENIFNELLERRKTK